MSLSFGRFDDTEDPERYRQHFYIEAYRERSGNVPTRGVTDFCYNLRKLKNIHVPSIGVYYTLFNIQSYPVDWKRSDRFLIYLDIVFRPEGLSEDVLEILYNVIKSRIRAIFLKTKNLSTKEGQFTLRSINVDMLNP